MAPSVLSTAVPAASKPPPASDDKPQNEGGGSGSKNQQPLKCPRCDSTNTKFCYYNNYSTAQPRHFCRACRRYWTHGGTLRDVPVGGASRRNGAKRRKIAAEPPEASPPPSGRADVPSLPTFPFVADVFCMPQLELEHGVAPAAWVLSPAAPDFYDGLAPWDDGARGVGVTGSWDNIPDFVSLELGWPPAPDN